MPTTVRHSIVVATPIERAFRVFIQGFGSFKPTEHNLLDVEIAETVFEPRVGDGIAGDGGWPLYVRRFAEELERSRDGTHHDR